MSAKDDAVMLSRRDVLVSLFACAGFGTAVGATLGTEACEVRGGDLEEALAVVKYNRWPRVLVQGRGTLVAIIYTRAPLI